VDGFGEAFVEEETAAPAATAPGEMAGLPAAPGVAAGPAARLRAPEIAVPDTAPGTRDALARAREQVAEALRTARGGIFAAQLDLLEDPELDAAVTEGLESGRNAAQAWSEAIEAQRARIAALDHPVFAARAADVADVGRRVLAALVGAPDEPAQVPRGAIALADDVVPSQVPALADAGAAGLALSGGAPGSHAAVLARGAGLPLVVGLGPALAEVADGRLLLLDGDRGTLRLEGPTDEVVRDARQAPAVDPAAREPVRTRDGTALRVGANVASRAEAERAISRGADEFGLVRTELAFLDRPTLPSEDEQVDRLVGICEAARGRPVVVRTLDVGGDKVAPALDLDPVRNGFLGQRGLRWSLAHPEVFGVQLRAILRASAGHRVRLMFPMVTTVSEVREARAALDDARRQLDESGSARGDVEEVGIMMGVPAAAVAAESLATEVDFFSIGSNDLLSYLMAADRTLGEVAGLRDPRHPAFLRLVSDVCAAARTAGIWVGVCGDTAGDPELAVLLARLGVTELSMAPPAIPSVKARLRAADLTELGPG
jgi:multiphosphoryl transfer protein